jgi:hypothetical protein
MSGIPPARELAAASLAFVLALGAVACDDRTPLEPDPSEELAGARSLQATVATLTETATGPYGTWDGISFTRHTGWFEGETSAGTFRVPFEIVAPDDPEAGRHIVMVEPSHFIYGTLGRDYVLGPDEVFGRGMSYAAVGWSTNFRSILDLSATGVEIGGEPTGQDPEILLEFAKALRNAPFAVGLLGEGNLLYGYGASQTSGTLLQVLHLPGAQGIFDLSFLNERHWPEFYEPELFDLLTGEFEPIDGVGKVVFVQTESELVLSEAEQLRQSVDHPDYRIYEVAGSAHLPTPHNPLNWTYPAEALWTAADAWVTEGTPPPPSLFIEPGPDGVVDPVYGFPTGIARDGDGNALGGIRLPSLAVGQALFIAMDPSTGAPLPPGFDFLSGNSVDLSCEPRPGSDSGEPRFTNHGDYVSAFAQQANELVAEGYLLAEDAESLTDGASASEIGKPGTCEF